MSVMQALKGVNRLKQIVNFLFKEELGFIIHKLGLKSHLKFEHQLKKGEFQKPITSLPARLRRVMENAGGAMVKLGQLLSLRSDLLPKEYCEEFSKLQDAVKPFPYEKVKQTIELELGKPLNKVFQTFSKTPIAAASVGQVHKAKLLTGQTVAVKIQRPGIQQIFETDIYILKQLAKQAHKHLKEAKPFNIPRIVNVFEEYTKKELNYKEEAKHIELIYQRSKKNLRVKIPAVFWDYTTPKVLTMSFIEGKRVQDAKLTKLERKKIAKIITNSLMEQIFEYHIFHADPHPGNILITKGKNIAFLDFGIVGRISPDMSDHVEDMLIGLVKGNLDMLTRSFIDIGIVDGEINENKFKEELFQRWGGYHGLSLKEMKMQDFFHDTFELARKYKMEFPSNFVILVKSIGTAEVLFRKIDPGSNFVKNCTPKVEELMHKRRSFKNIRKEIKKSAWGFSRTITKFPQDLRSLIHTIRKGTNVRVDIDNQDVRSLTHEIGTSSNRLTFGFIIGALIVGFALIVMANVEPTIYGVPYLALLLLAIIVIVSLFLGISILWDKKEVNK